MKHRLPVALLLVSLGFGLGALSGCLAAPRSQLPPRGKLVNATPLPLFAARALHARLGDEMDVTVISAKKDLGGRWWAVTYCEMPYVTDTGMGQLFVLESPGFLVPGSWREMADWGANLVQGMPQDEYDAVERRVPKEIWPMVSHVPRRES